MLDIGKKDIGEGIVIIFTNKEGKIGLAVGVTDKLTKNYDAVKFAKIGSELIGGNGGGGRVDFAQAGGTDFNKIDQAIEKLKSSIEGDDTTKIAEDLEALTQEAMKLGEAIYKAQPNSQEEAPSEPQDPEDGTIVDADFEEVDEENKS